MLVLELIAITARNFIVRRYTPEARGTVGQRSEGQWFCVVLRSGCRSAQSSPRVMRAYWVLPVSPPVAPWLFPVPGAPPSSGPLPRPEGHHPDGVRAQVWASLSSLSSAARGVRTHILPRSVDLVVDTRPILQVEHCPLTNSTFTSSTDRLRYCSVVSLLPFV